MIAIYLTTHARERAFRRTGLTVAGIAAEVRAAHEAGRRAKAKPRWACEQEGDRRHGVKAGTYRYFWNEEETHAYLCVQGRGEWRVITVLTRTEEQ